MFAVVLVYAGFIAMLLGGASLVKPLAFLGIRSRRRGVVVLATGLLLAGTGFAFPAPDRQITTPRTRLDEFVPVYQFNESHSIRVAAPKDRVYDAIRAVSADEILLFRTLTWIRRFGCSDSESILNAPEHQPLLDVATRTGFLLLAEERDREVVVGTAVVAPRAWQPQRRIMAEDFKALREPGFALAVMNFLIEDAGPGACVVSTETRVYATDPSARRRFAAYWRVIYPGSALIRRMWLRAVKRRAEDHIQRELQRVRVYQVRRDEGDRMITLAPKKSIMPVE